MEYVAELKRLAATCQFEEFLNIALRDRFVCGLKHEATQKNLLTEVNLTLERATEIALGIESAEKTVRDFKSSETVAVKKVEVKVPPPRKSEKCQHCGRSNHLSKDCRLKNAVCYRCKKRGHIAAICTIAQPTPGQDTSSQHHSRGATKWVERYLVDEESDKEQELRLFTMDKGSNPWTVDLLVNDTSITMEIDTGASVSLISSATKEKFFPQVGLCESSDILKAYTNEKISVEGVMEVEVKHANNCKTLTLYVVTGTGPSLICRE